jgi:carbamate kinase
MKRYTPAAIIRRRKIAAMIGTGFLFICSGGAGIPGEILKLWLAGNRG